MKHRIIGIFVALLLLIALVAVPAQAATEDEIEASIDSGIAWLVAQQQDNGSWGGHVAMTGLAVTKLEDRALEIAKFYPDIDGPFDEDYEYSENVINGLNFIFSQAAQDSCGLYFPNNDTYNTGIAMMAIANSKDMDRVVEVAGSIVDGWTYGAVLEANVAYFANSQQISGLYEGGWAYGCNEGWADNSNSGYAVLGLRYAETEGIAIPDSLKVYLNNWINYIQNDVSGDANDGGSGYESPDSWVNTLKTGNLLFQMQFFGDTLATPRVQHAIDYIELHWDDPSSMIGSHGWIGHIQAMYCLMKGLDSIGVETLTVNRGGEDEEVDWFDEISTAVVGMQLADGSWPEDYWGNKILATAWALLSLERVVPDVDPPEVWCEETVNPHGNNIPGEKRSDNAKEKAQNPDGFYQLFAEDFYDPNPAIWVGTEAEPFLFGPFVSGTRIKFTEAPGKAPSCKKIGSANEQADAILCHITLPTDPFVSAIDASRNIGTCGCCLVPPPPK